VTRFDNSKVGVCGVLPYLSECEQVTGRGAGRYRNVIGLPQGGG